MKFVREQLIEHQVVAGGFDANGNPTTSAVEVQTERKDLVLGNGVSTFDILQRDLQKREEVQSVALGAAFTDEATFEIDLNGNNQVFVTLHSIDLGATLTGVVVLIEFQDPDHSNYWIPSKESANRESDSTTHEWSLVGTGAWIVASREEHRQFTKARVRFRALGGAADADTQVLTSYHHNGGRSLIEIHGNDTAP